jgi:hypothetical protein
MPSPTTCICTLNVRDLLGVAITSAELVCHPRKSYLEGTYMISSAPQRAVAVAGVCTLTLPESAVAGQKVMFQLIYVQNGQPYDIIFEPITIPNSASVDLSTLLTVNRG